MKNKLLIFAMSSFCVNSFGQIPDFKDIPKNILEQLGKVVVNDSLLLNYYESAYFNLIFEKCR